jgi:hypothetical protein
MEHQDGAGEPRRRAREGGEPTQFRIAEFESNSSTRPPRIKIDVHIAYNLQFGRSTYARKGKEIKFPMALVSCPTKIGLVRNHQSSTDF